MRINNCMMNNCDQCASKGINNSFLRRMCSVTYKQCIMAGRADGISVQLTNKFLDFLVENPEFLETHLFIKNISTV